MNFTDDRRPWQDLAYRADPGMEEKIVFFSDAAVTRAAQEGRLPESVAEELKEVLRRPGEIAAVLEWNGIADWKKRQATRSLLAMPQPGHGRYYDSHGNPRSIGDSGRDNPHFGGIH